MQYNINFPHSDFADEECAIPHWMQRMQIRWHWQKYQQNRQNDSFLKVIKGLKTYRSGATAAFMARGASFLAHLSPLQETGLLPPN